MRMVSRLAGVVSLVVPLLGCGGGGGAGLPLVSGSLTGSYDGTEFTPTTGFAIVTENGAHMIGVGDSDANLNCSSPEQNDAPSGSYAAMQLPDFAVGSYASVYVLVYQNTDEFEGVGSNGGSVTITAVSDETVAGTVEYDYTNEDSENYTLSGSFEVTRCPE